MESLQQDQPLHSLSSDYLALFTNGQAAFSDVTFCIDGKQVHAHKCILAARSPFFRLMFSCESQNAAAAASSSIIANAPSILHTHSTTNSANASPTGQSASVIRTPSVIPVDIIGYHAFITLIQFLYSGQLIYHHQHQIAANVGCHSPVAAAGNPAASIQNIGASASSPASVNPTSPPIGCPHRSCSHSNCSFAVDLSLELIHAAKFFGVDQLCSLVERKLASVLEGVSVENLMRILIVAKKQKLQHLWAACSDLVMSSGVACEVLRRYLPREVLSELADVKLQRSYGTNTNLQLPPHILTSPGAVATTSANHDEHRILRLQQALDCMDVELVKLMVMGEGLNLDKAHALHYSVANCNREVVKALLEMGVVDVNYANGIGRTALHLAAEMGNAEMIAVLLDHHADPNAQTEDGLTALDIVRCLISGATVEHHHGSKDRPIVTAGVVLPLSKSDQKRIHLCIELLQSAAAVAGRDDAAESSSCVTQAGATPVIMGTQINDGMMQCGGAMIPDPHHHHHHHDQRGSNLRRINVINQDAARVLPALSIPKQTLSPAATPTADQQQQQHINYGYLFSAYPELMQTVADTDNHHRKSTTISGSSS